MMQTLRLGDLLKIKNGFAFKSNLFCDKNSGIPVIRIGDIYNNDTGMNYNGPYRDDFLVSNGDILIGMSGDFSCYIWNGPQALLNQRVCRLECFINDVDPKYIFYWIQPKLKKLHSETSFLVIKNLSSRTLEELEIELPPLAEQQRIVDILDRTASIQRLRAEADAKLRELIPALFVDMFGDPVTNPKGWSVKKFSQLGQLDRGKSRHRPRDAAELYDGPYPFIQTGDVAKSDGYIRSYSATYSELGLAQSKLWRAGTLCITIAANIAKTGILCFDACFPDSVVGYIPNNEALTEYIRAWLSFLQPTLEANAPQAAQKNINLEILRDLPVSLPPIELQTKFSDYVSALYSVRQQSEKSKASIILTNDSLLHELLG